MRSCLSVIWRLPVSSVLMLSSRPLLIRLVTELCVVQDNRHSSRTLRTGSHTAQNFVLPSLRQSFLFFIECSVWLTKIRRGVEQLAARQAHNLKVGGSSPFPAIFPYENAWVVWKKRRKTLKPCMLVQQALVWETTTVNKRMHRAVWALGDLKV